MEGEDRKEVYILHCSSTLQSEHRVHVSVYFPPWVIHQQLHSLFDLFLLLSVGLYINFRDENQQRKHCVCWLPDQSSEHCRSSAN